MVEDVGVRLNRPDLPVSGVEFFDQAHRLLMVILQKLCGSHAILLRKISGVGNGEWGVGNGGQRSYLLDSLLPIPHSPLPRSSIYILLTYRAATTMPDGARSGSSGIPVVWNTI